MIAESHGRWEAGGATHKRRETDLGPETPKAVGYGRRLERSFSQPCPAATARPVLQLRRQQARATFLSCPLLAATLFPRNCTLYSFPLLSARAVLCPRPPPPHTGRRYAGGKDENASKKG